MLKSRITRQPVIPSLSSRKSVPVTTDFSGGIRTYPPNDKLRSQDLAIAHDVRFVRAGKPRTKKGNDLFVDAIGKEVQLEEMATPDRSYPASDTDVVKRKFTASTNFRLWQLDLFISRNASTQGVAMVSIHKSFNGTPGERIATSTPESNSAPLDFSTPVSFRFNESPDLDADTEYFVIVTAQNGSVGEYNVGVSDEYSDTEFSSDAGMIWDTAEGGLCMRVYSAEVGQVTSIFAGKYQGVITYFFLFNGILYRCGANGIPIIQNDNLPAGTTVIRYDQTENIIRYTCNTGNPRKISLADFSEEEIETGRGNVRNIKYHIAYEFYMSADDENGVFTSEAAPDGIDSFDSTQTFVANIPQAKSGDGLTAMESLGGTLYFLTRRNKYALFGETWQTFSSTDAAARTGTFSQESLTADTNYIYYASDEGIFIFNGTSEKNLVAEDIQNIWDDIPNKETTVLDIYGGRLYIFYCDNTSAHNDKALVYNLDLGVWESIDINAFVSSSCGRKNRENKFVQGHSRVGVLSFAEQTSNTHHNMGAPLYAEVSTFANPYGTPQQLKRITKHRPEFDTERRNYSAECGFSKDFTGEPEYMFDVELGRGGGITYNSGRLYNNGEKYGGAQIGTKRTTEPYVFGDFYRCQLWYRHYAAHEPIAINAHTVTLQTQRIR